MKYSCDECGWAGAQPTRLELAIADGSKPTQEDLDLFADANGLMPCTCPECGCLVVEEEK